MQSGSFEQPFGKVAVMGLLERHGEVRAKIVPDTKTCNLQVQVERT